MIEQATYYKPTKLDYLCDAATLINNEMKLKGIINKMNPNQIRAVFDEFEDPYSSYNYDREYYEYYWSRFKKAVLEVRPDFAVL